MGFELSFHMPCITEVDFVEVQSAYNEYFQQNIAITSSKKENFRFHNINVTEVAASLVLHSYDIVLCNPPYFWPGAGVFSPSELKNRSRFLLDCTFENIVTSMLTLLSEGGSGFLLVRDLSVNGVNQMELLEKCIEGKARIEGKYLVRGRTGLVWFSAKAKQDSIL